MPLSDAALLDILRDRVETGRSAGIVVGFVDRGQARTVSYGDTRPGGPPLDANTVFEIGSITKVLTTTVLADMVVTSDVQLGDPVASYLPASVRMPRRGEKEITLLDLATHTSGLPRIPSNLAPYDPMNPYGAYSVEQLYEFLSAYELPRDIGSSYEYSNLGAGLLGHVLARAAGVTFEELVTMRTLQPLGMTDTKIGLTESMRARHAQGYDEGGNPVSLWDFPTLAGAGAFRSTANDMLKFLAASVDLSRGPLARAMALAQPGRYPVDGAPNLRVGLGWHTLRVGQAEIVWHNGQTGGYHAFIGVDHATTGNVLVLGSSCHDIDDIGFHLIDQRLPVRPMPKTRSEIVLDVSILDRYVGTYELAQTLSMPAFPISVSRRDRALVAEVPGKGEIELFAESETDFFLRVMDAQVSFVCDSNGVVTGLVLHQRGTEQRGVKVRTH